VSLLTHPLAWRMAALFALAAFACVLGMVMIRRLRRGLTDLSLVRQLATEMVGEAAHLDQRMGGFLAHAMAAKASMEA
jgi:hypothetical protein